MRIRPNRRTLLKSAAATAALAALGRPGSGLAAESLQFGPSLPFSYESLVEEARVLAGTAYAPPNRPMPAAVQQIDYEAHGKIDFRRDLALFAGGPGVYPTTFFHLGQFFQKTVRMNVVEGDTAREVLYAPTYFRMPADSPAQDLPPDAGFAGFRLHESRLRDDWRTQDWVAFLGASYFRAIGALNQYGLSARGVTVDTAAPTPEEFPDFVAFYIAPALNPDDPAVVHALLDGPSITGAFRFSIMRTEGVVMDVEAALFARQSVYRLGIAPLTSMYWFSEAQSSGRQDWRPEVHDSDGLALWTGGGERVWRPLNNPERVMTSSFADENPRGFGLLQRDRDFEHYLDGVHYERRPSLWVEPLGDWGAGAVQLVEIPTDDEIHDNIVAFWVPAEPVVAGSSYSLRYRLHWLADEPFLSTDIARTVATRLGRGGKPGKPRPDGVRKFVIEFAGGPLLSLPDDAEPVPVIDTSRGSISYVFAERIPDTDRWRVQFDLTASGTDPVELRVYLDVAGQPLTETWLYQYHPMAPDPQSASR